MKKLNKKCTCNCSHCIDMGNVPSHKKKPVDVWENARKNANRNCPQCRGTGSYMYDHNHSTICKQCCKHNMGWFKLVEHYGENNNKWCCRAGCGRVVDEKPEE